jgi:hypothetical protein
VKGSGTRLWGREAVRQVMENEPHKLRAAICAFFGKRHCWLRCRPGREPTDVRQVALRTG